MFNGVPPPWRPSAPRLAAAEEDMVPQRVGAGVRLAGQSRAAGGVVQQDLQEPLSPGRSCRAGGFGRELGGGRGEGVDLLIGSWEGGGGTPNLKEGGGAAIPHINHNLG